MFELWSQFAFLNPGLLGSVDYFKKEFAKPIQMGSDDKAAEFLRKTVYPFILRRTKGQVATDLPPRTDRILYIDMEPAQKKLYHKTRDDYRSQLLGAIQESGLQGARMKILEGLLRLRQISNHGKLVSPNFRGDSGKMLLLLDTIENLAAEGHKALIFSQFVQMLTLIRQELDKRNISLQLSRWQHPQTARTGRSVPDRSQQTVFLDQLKSGWCRAQPNGRRLCHTRRSLVESGRGNASHRPHPSHRPRQTGLCLQDDHQRDSRRKDFAVTRAKTRTG